MPETIEAWVIIPARGGSVGIPRKNLRRVGGKPLIAHAIDMARSVLPRERVIVVTDDQEIASVASEFKATVILESERTPGSETLDEKILRNLPRLREMGANANDLIVTVQPTSPLLQADSLRKAIDTFAAAGVRSVLSVADDRHLRWRIDEQGAPSPAYRARVNRQQLPAEWRETGGIIAARLADIETERTRIIEPTRVLVLDAEEALDIDSYSDLYAAAHLLSRKRIAVRVDASTALGMGHVYRMLALAAELARHDLRIFLSEELGLGAAFFADYPYRVELLPNEDEFARRLQTWQPDLVVFDVLDTSAEQISEIKATVPGCKIITFEDIGDGAMIVDLLVSEFVDNAEVPLARQLVGIEHALLSPSFELSARDLAEPHDEVAEVLVLFGGTDPSQLAERALASLGRVGFSGKVTVVRGLGAAPLSSSSATYPFDLEMLQNVKNMPELMSRSDFAFTSAGRTIVELLSRGKPAICMAQNEKELTHNHATEHNGIMMLGLGTRVTDQELDHATAQMLHDQNFRAEATARASAAGDKRSNRATISAILKRIGFEDFPEI